MEVSIILFYKVTYTGTHYLLLDTYKVSIDFIIHLDITLMTLLQFISAFNGIFYFTIIDYDLQV